MPSTSLVISSVSMVRPASNRARNAVMTFAGWRKRSEKRHVKSRRSSRAVFRSVRWTRNAADGSRWRGRAGHQIASARVGAGAAAKRARERRTAIANSHVATDCLELVRPKTTRRRRIGYTHYTHACRRSRPSSSPPLTLPPPPRRRAEAVWTFATRTGVKTKNKNPPLPKWLIIGFSSLSNFAIVLP